MRVLHIIKSLGRGGAEMLLQETLKEHHSDKFEFHYIYFLPWKNQMVEGIQNAGGIVINMPAQNNIQIILQLKKILQYIKENKIDVIHCHLPWTGFLGRIIFKIKGIPVLYTEHNIQNRYHFFTKVINKFTFNWQTKVIAVSNEVAKSIEQSIRPKIPVKTVLNGVNTLDFIRNPSLGLEKRKEMGISFGTILIGTIAVFRFQKRLKEWIDVFKNIHDVYPEVRGCIVGDGILKEEIMEHLKNKGMENYIFFPGLETDVKPWLSAMDIFMMTSSFEGLPIAMLEAMSMECAIVTTDAGGIKEVINNGKDGFLVPLDEWQSLVKPLSYLIQNPSEIKNFGVNARLRVEHSFGMKAMVQQIEKIYLEAYDQKK